VLLLAGLALSVGFGRGRWAEFPAGLAGAFKYLGWVGRVLFINLAIVAGVFAVIERIRARQRAEGKLQAEKWNPRELPEVEDTERVSAAGRVWRIYCIVVFFIVLNFFPQFFGVIFFSGDEVRTLPVLDLGVRIPVLLLNLWWVLALALNMTLLRQGRWNFATRWWEFGLGLFGALILYVTLTGSVFIADVNWFAEHGWVESARSVKVGEKLLPFFNKVLRGALWVALFFALLESAQRMWRLSTRYREQWSRLLSSSVW
jgi:hypothetical protein